ncbi:MAG: PEGA domain-containing protein [Sandaracinaceae bacterium]|nr:PEGA domain-containing protein [Sandaracinaceae bacterium]
MPLVSRALVPAVSFASVFATLLAAWPVRAQQAPAREVAPAEGAAAVAPHAAPMDTAVPSPDRVLVMRVGGEEALASALGTSLRDAVHAHTRTLSLTPLPTDGGCDDLECGAGFLATGAADLAELVEVFGHNGVCEGVQATVLVADGTRYVGTAEVGTAGVEDAMRVALAQAIARFRGEALPTLGVNGEPAGATIRVDGVTWGTVPHAEPISPGHHVVEVRARGHRTDRREITLGGEDLTLDVQLSPGEDGAAGGELGLWIAGAAGVALGVAGLVVGIAGFAMGESCTDPSCTSYMRPDAIANGVWLGAGGALTVTGGVLLGLAASSGGGDGDRAMLRVTGSF